MVKDLPQGQSQIGRLTSQTLTLYLAKKNNEPKGKAQMMRDMRERRKKEGLFEMSVWVTSEQEKQVLELLSK